MTINSLIRFIVGIFIAALLLCIVMPLIGIPRAQLFPPAVFYASADGKTQGVVTKKHTSPTSNPFHVGDHICLIDYSFRAPYTPLLGGDRKSDPNKIYSGTVKVSNEDYDKFKVDMTVPVKYDKTYPVISGIDAPEGGRNGANGSGIVSGWMIWAGVTVILGYAIAPWLERFMLRESY